MKIYTPLGAMGRGAGWLGLALACAGLAQAQTGPLPNSPGQPTPYIAPMFHAGGAPPPVPNLFPAITVPGQNPLFGQLQGTPTGPNTTPGGVSTQIPSYLLGNYNPAEPPGYAGAFTYYPDHFADGNIFAWTAPFDYIPASASAVTVDDSDAVNFTASGFVNIPAPIPPAINDVPGTATSGEYDRLPPNTNGLAVWTLTASTSGSYSVYFHIPDNIDDGNGFVEQRSTAVDYTIIVTGASGQTTIATASQTEANSLQYLAGPFQMATGDTVTVILQRDTTHNQANAADYLIADSMTLQPSIGDVRSTPTAINATAYPAEFANAKYWGVTAGGAPATTGNTATLLNANAPPDVNLTTGLPVLRTGDPNQSFDKNGAADRDHIIRQLVYFGRSEPAISSGTSVDNSSPAFTNAGGWSNVTPDSTATNGSYLHVAAVSGPTASATATWALTAPTLGNYFLSVHLPQLTGTTTPTEQRIPDATYTVTYGSPLVTKVVKISQVTGIGAASTVFLPTGPITLNAGQTVTVTLGNNTAVTPLAVNPPYDVVADSVSMATSPGTGAIYCVDGFTGEVVWRFETPSSAHGPSAPVFSSPAIAKINVQTGTNPVTYANKLVVIVGDDNGLVYCLDAIGNGDGTSNSNVFNTTTGQPIYLPQPTYGAAPPAQVSASALPANPHVGTTPVYWIYRPDPNQPKDITTGAVKAKPDPLSDLPVPGAFGPASPTIFVDPSVPPAATGATTAASNATVFVGNSNGVLYALDALGVAIDGTSAATYAATGDKFDVSLDFRNDPTAFPAVTTDPVIPTCQPKWWFTLRGPNPNSGTGSTSADIESAPAISVSVTGTTYTPTVYIGSAHEQESTSNVGRLYALNGLYGPSGNNGQNYPTTAAGAPGTPNYNVGQRPQISKTDTADWAFPDAYGTDNYSTGKSSNSKPRPALGNITGSPVVFTDPNETDPTRQTRVYFAANVGVEVPAGSTVPAVRPDDTLTGRVWAVNLDGSVGTTTRSGAGGAVWAYPLANDPNNASLDNTPEPFAPIGAFLHATPAIGFVQFPANITNGDGTPYTHLDAMHADIKGQSVPMLYVGTRGVNDTALYAVDIDGSMTGAGTDTRTIYRQISPDGAIFQSSPMLVTNATTNGGNGGAVYITGGNTLYDFSATPISNPITGQSFPLIRENRAFVGFGPISSPTVAAADVSDLTLGVTLPGSAGGKNATDWVYVGDSSTGFCRGITPSDATDLAIPAADLGVILPPYDPPNPVALNAILQTYLVPEAKKSSTSYSDALPVGKTAPLPVYEWGQNVYIRIANVVPPNPGNVALLYVHDAAGADPATATADNPVTLYADGGPIEFDLADASPDNSNRVQYTDHATIPATIVTALPANGIIARTDTGTTPNLAGGTAATPTRWIGAYTYAIGDGTARKNTPGGRRRLINVHQTVKEYAFTGTFPITTAPKTVILSATATLGNVVSVLAPTNPPSYQSNFNVVQPVDQPTFGILNPLGVRGGGVPLSLTGVTPAGAVEIGDPLGPFRGTAAQLPPPGGSGDFDGLQALANGNSIYTTGAPPSTSLSGDPTQLATGTNDVAGNSLPTAPKTVVTATGLINHNQSGDNSDPSNIGVPSGAVPSGNTTPTGEYLSSTNFGSPDRPYAFDLFDRSALSLVAKTMKVKMDQAGTGGRGGLYWNDNSSNVSGHDSVVNYLPWEAPPVGYKTGSNTSPDYPNIATSNLSFTLHADDANGGSSGSLGQDGVIPTPVTGSSADVMHRTVYASPVQVHINVPPYQPANQQLYSKTRAGVNGYSTFGETTPQGIGGTGDKVFPMGYVTTKRIYVPDQYGRYESGCAYREVTVYTGVPPSMSASISTPTADIGPVPSGFGIQTGAFNPLGLFTPYNTNFQSYYLPVTAHNDGNVNWLDVHFDQKYLTTTGNGSLIFPSDTIDPLSAIPAFDNFGATGPRTGTFGSVAELPFLLRSSVDTDLGAAYGRNPGIVGDPNLSLIYPSTTFHKALVGSVAPALTVPDVPSNNISGTTYYVPSSSTFIPTSSVAVPVPGTSTLPFVSLAVPFGTPYGTYSQTVRLFEGMDPTGYTTYDPTTRNYNPLYPPQYGGTATTPGAIGGIGIPPSQPSDTYQFGVQPISDPGVIVKANVVEDRMTDGFTFGALPQIDNGPASSGKSTPDFAPAAFQAPGGNLSAYWTSGRGSGYGIYGANVNFTSPAYLPASGGQSWFTQFTPTLAGGTNSGLTIAQDVPVLSGSSFATTGKAYAFAVNVANTQPYQNTLYSYTADPVTGALSNPLAITSDPAQVKYGIRGLYCSNAGFTNSLWAFWTASTRGRTAIYYNSCPAGANWPTTSMLLPIPAGLTAVSDACPALINAPVGTTLQQTIEVTFSGTAADGNADLYVCRYIPDSKNAAQLDLQSFQQVTEILKPIKGWLQARDVAWSRTAGLNVFVGGVPVLYTNGASPTPLFSRATFDKASGLLVFSGVSLTGGTGGTNTLYVDASTGRVRFTTPPTGEVRATFTPQARRITDDARADTGVVTFLDPTYKYSEAPGLGLVPTDRRWYFWRKAGVSDDTTSATLYEKSQRLTVYLPKPVDFTQTPVITVNGSAYSGAFDLANQPTSSRLYFPIASSAGYNEGQSVSVVYKATDGSPVSTALDTIQWQDELRANDVSSPPTDAASGLATVIDTKVPMDKRVNENNVTAFLDVNAYNNVYNSTFLYPHKIWLFWNSTRNGTADLYYETINPRFTAVGP